MVNKRKWGIWVAVLLVIAFFTSMYYYAELGNNSYTSVTMFIYVEKKEHYIGPGHLKMWVIGSNSSDSSQNKLKYKVMIKDSRIYNLLEEGKEYFVTLEGVKKKNQSEYTYTFGQLGIPGGTQLTGEGIIE
ncbi:hypothetical protein [Paenibacillus contaminans]|uniref:Uncharacterized protein n=1 Tax=Paenibacillus contaminans TaxID=450362 RepID=A0A329M1I3_9BACL|nr:hypothetical protein [Paenibacillus contaminans]RAV13570.1 hypothetical protein DQG23_32750 [Paenibacillus contaminans]